MASRNMTMLYGLGGRIRETREQHGLSLTDLSVAVGSDKSALSKIEKGERVPNLETIGRLADELDVPMTVWFQETASSNTNKEVPIMTNLDHILSLTRHGAKLRNQEDGSLMPLTEDFYHHAVEACNKDGYNAATYELVMPDIDSELWLAIWKDGHVDSGSPKGICDCLAR